MRTALALIVVASFLSLGSAVAKEYTPAQLRQMAAAGKFPPQGATHTETRPMEFSDCREYSLAMFSALGPDYPTRVVVDSDILFTIKGWFSDGAVMASCSKPDRKLILTRSPYR